MVRLSPVSGSASRWSYRGSDFLIGSRARIDDDQQTCPLLSQVQKK
jgi:hypothetical protein